MASNRKRPAAIMRRIERPEETRPLCSQRLVPSVPALRSKGTVPGLAGPDRLTAATGAVDHADPGAVDPGGVATIIVNEFVER